MDQPAARRGGAGAVLAVLAAAALFGTTGTAQALGPSGTTPLGVGAARIVIGGLGLLLVLPRVGGSRRAALALWRTRWGLVAGVMTAAYQVCFFGGVARAGVALGTLVTIGSGPVFTGLLSWLVLRDRPRSSWVVATAVCVVGLGLLVGGDAGGSGASLVGLALALCAGAAYAVYTVGAKHLMNEGHRSDDVMTAAFVLGALVMLPLMLTQPLAWLATPRGLVMALWLGLATTTLAYVVFGRGLRQLSAGPVTTLVLAEPVVATFLGVVVLGERLPVVAWVGAALVLAGLALQGVVAARGGAASEGSRDADAAVRGEGFPL